MKKTAQRSFPLIIVLSLCMTAGNIALSAQQIHPVGLGLVLGEPTGMSSEIRLDSINSLQTNLAWSFSPGGFFQVGSGYLRYFPGMFSGSKMLDALYAGAGVRTVFQDAREDIALRFPVGLASDFHDSMLRLFVEFAPMYNFHPIDEFDMNGALGLRFFFGGGHRSQVPPVPAQ